MNIIYDCEAYGVEPPQEKYIMLFCESVTYTYTWFGQRALYLHPGAIPHDQGMSYGNFVCCGLTLNVTSYSDNSNETNYLSNIPATHITNYTTNTNVTNYFTNNTLSTYISPDKYSEYALIMSGVSLLISITLVIVSMVISCRNSSENRALRYTMYNHTPNPQIPIRIT